LLIKEDLGITWLLPSGTRSEAMDGEVVRKLKQSGCLTLNFAPESGSPRMLELIKKQVDLDKMLASVRACTREGVYTRANIIFGMPGDTAADMLLTLRYIVRLAWAGMHDIGVFPFVPYPGCALHDQLRARGAFPPEGPEYDRVLLGNGSNDYWRPRSWNESLSDRQLRVLLIGASLLFYVSQYSLRPWRVAQSIARLARRRPITFIERVTANSLGRIRFMLRRGPRSVADRPRLPQASLDAPRNAGHAGRPEALLIAKEMTVRPE